MADKNPNGILLAQKSGMIGANSNESAYLAGKNNAARLTAVSNSVKGGMRSKRRYKGGGEDNIQLSLMQPSYPNQNGNQGLLTQQKNMAKLSAGSAENAKYDTLAKKGGAKKRRKSRKSKKSRKHRKTRKHRKDK